MGQEIDDRDYVDERTFLKRLREETRLVARTYKQGGFQQFDRPMIGAEVEAWMLDENWLPAPENDAFLKAYDQPLATHELASFNFELRTSVSSGSGTFHFESHRRRRAWFGPRTRCGVAFMNNSGRADS